ncbi:MAG: HAD-IB family phosphatase [Elusimicrobiaceae bacterium]|nr:HAD-IB family phosphatase [Elusimicrobiaceae bacterium]
MTSKPEKWAVVADFDGTVSMKDVSDELCFHFKTASRAGIRGSYAPGVKVEDWLAASFGAITARRGEIEKFVSGFARPRAGARRFYEYCRRNGLPFEIASGGLDIYIAPLLEKWGLGDSRYFCAAVTPARPAGYSVNYRKMLGRAATVDEFKAQRVRRLKKQGFRVLFCGDGTSDLLAALEADAVFARFKLARLCARAGKKTKRLVSFDAALKFLKDREHASGAV